MATVSQATDEMLRQMIDRFWDTVPPLWRKIRGNVRTIASEKYHINVEQFHTLRHIKKGTCLVSELAAVQQLSRSAISQEVDELVHQGLVCRHQNVKDRRYVRLELTPKGNDLLDAVFGENRAWMMERLISLSPEEVQSVTDALNTLKNTFYKMIV